MSINGFTRVLFMLLLHFCSAYVGVLMGRSSSLGFGNKAEMVGGLVLIFKE